MTDCGGSLRCRVDAGVRLAREGRSKEADRTHKNNSSKEADMTHNHAQTQAWLAKQGIDPDEWGLSDNPSQSQPVTSDHADTDRIISILRAS